jgi:esterase/lipase superfamily enzyme
MKLFFLAALTALFALSCSTTQAPSTSTPANPPLPSATSETVHTKTINEQVADLLNASRTEKFSDTLPMDVYYVTNRRAKESKDPCSDGYSIEKSDKAEAEGISYGICRVNVPKIHATGQISYSNDYTDDSDRYFKILSHKKLNFDSFQSQAAKSRTKEILVFVHGFNVPFQDAVLRASQLAYDLKFQGSVVLFSWPAGADNGFLSAPLIAQTYSHNKSNAAKSVGDAVDFFDLLSRIDLKTYVYVHSMGHQVVIPALVELAKNTDISLLVHELILNAPDFDLKEFVKLSPDLLKLAKHITIYCSYNDNALLASQRFNGGARIGGCELIPGMDVINVSEIDEPILGLGLGHSYYSSRAVLTDVAQLIVGVEAENRLFVRKSGGKKIKENYFLRP